MSMPAKLIPAVMNLHTLLQGIVDAPAISISGVATDSRLLNQGDVFLACAGETNHGMDFANQAIASGVAAIVYDADTSGAVDIQSAVPIIAVHGLQQHIGVIASRWFSSPSESVTVTAITGTNGKTTVAMILAQCMRFLGNRCGYIGTLGRGIDELGSNDGLTSPACLQLHQALADFRDDGATHATIEVSSHALAQGRTDGVQLDSAIFTNLSRDHIDYHGDMQSYFETKVRLFTDNLLQHRIISIDSEYGHELARRCMSNVVLVSTNFDRVANGRSFVFVRAVVAEAAGSRVRFDSSWGSAEFRIAMPGAFNVENSALVLALLLRHGRSLADACSALSQVSAPPGRMQRVEIVSESSLPRVYVDYAHTPAGLELALRALRQHCKGELWCVFGCGGDRDRGKRPQMGKLVSRLADHGVVTNDNPRTEDPSNIIGNIVAGMGSAAIVIEDRAAAIAYAISEARASDTILIAGKGHESVQIIGSQEIAFSDYTRALENLELRVNRGVELS